MQGHECIDGHPFHEGFDQHVLGDEAVDGFGKEDPVLLAVNRK